MAQHDYEVIVIGSGIGGSACAALLAKQGFKTLLLEKNDQIGGICAYYQKRGFHVDFGTHLFSRGDKGPLGEVERLLGIPGRIEFIPTVAHMKGLGFDLTMPRHLYQMPGYECRLYKQLGLTPRELLNLTRLTGALLCSSDEKLALWNHRPLEELIQQYTSNIRVIAYLSLVVGLFFVLPMWEASAGEAIYCTKKASWDNMLSYPRGGAVTVPRTYVEVAVHYGAQVLTNARVKKIHLQNSSVTSVELADGRAFTTQAVVSTTALKDTVTGLVGRRHFPASYIKKIEEIKSSTVAVQAKIALDKPVFKEGCLLGFGTPNHDIDYHDLKLDDLRDMFRDLAKGKVPKVVPLYCPIPTNHDPHLAPRGKQLLTLCTGAPTLDLPQTDSPEMWKESLLKAFEDTFPEIKGHIEWVDFFDVKFVANWIGKKYGAAITTGQTVDQVGERRPSVRSPVRGLYFAGDCAGGRGIGTELAAASAITCSETVTSDFQQGLVG